jgi:hypothetical protein
MHAIHPKPILPEYTQDPPNPAVGEAWITTSVSDPAGSLQTTGLLWILINDDPLASATVKVQTSLGVINLGSSI